MPPTKTKLKINKTTLATGLLVVLLFSVYWFFLRGRDYSFVAPAGSVNRELIGRELLEELNRLEDLNKLDEQFFEDPLFSGLRDITVNVAPQPVGRANPFLPTGQGL